METVADVLLAAYLVLLAGLAAFGLHRLALLRRFGGAPPGPPSATFRDGGRVPWVTVQLPVYNERYVVARLIRAAIALDWPTDRLEIQVLDDSTDDTREIAASLVSHYRSRGHCIRHLTRTERTGFKAGALAAGHRIATGEFLAIFDADFLPPREFLRRALPSFADPQIGMVQARWGHLNRGQSLLTRLQAIFLDGHFRVEHAARQRAGLFFNFNGTAGIWRRACLDAAGGWQADTLTEDLDLSYRAQLAGWRFVYRDDLEAPAELPADIAAFKSQQHRWTIGSVQTLRKLGPSILQAPLPPRQKVEALFHLGNNLAYLLLLALALLLVASLPARSRWGWPLVAVETPLFLLGTGSFCWFFLRSQRAAGATDRRAAAMLPGVMALGIALAVNNGRAVLEALAGGTGEFRRTPKRGRHRRETRYSLPIDPGIVLEIGITLWLVAGLGWVADEGIWTALPFLCLFAAGFGGIVLAQLAERLGRRAAERPARGSREIDEIGRPCAADHRRS